MLCQNCGKNEANVKYTEVINGVKKEMRLCEECSQKFGIENKIGFNMPLDFTSFLGDFFGEYENSLLPEFMVKQNPKCYYCGMSFDEFREGGKFGCENCYEEFSEKIDTILNNIQGRNRHVGRIGRLTNGKVNYQEKEDKEVFDKKEKTEFEKLNDELKVAIKEERYEDAAIIRDKIKDITNKESGEK